MKSIFAVLALLTAFASAAHATVYRCIPQGRSYQLWLTVDTDKKTVVREGEIRGIQYREVHTTANGYFAEKHCWEDPIDRAYPIPEYVPGSRRTKSLCFDITAKVQAADRDLPPLNGGNYYLLEMRELGARLRPQAVKNGISEAWSCSRVR
ncbi:MAG TPA: hypothetical protein VFV50_15430 [Bdellovibrionales bacterium]|nr:hypothetical protein [Bdellovibrionales bacterium]